jgi:hypothetical protein
LHLGIDRDVRAYSSKALQVVDPQRDGNTVLLLQLSGQTPADADVAEVIDDLAENSQ